MSKEMGSFEEDEYVDVRSLPLRPPQRAPPPERASRRPWHPVMWGHAAPDALAASSEDQEQSGQHRSKEYPHKQRMRNLKRLIAEGKVKPTSETLIFFLCNKFAISEERQAKMLE